MATTQRLNLLDVRALLRLLNGLHEGEPEPTMRKQRLLRELCALTGADAASAAVASFERGARVPPRLISFVSDGAGHPLADGGREAGTESDGPPWESFRRQLSATRHAARSGFAAQRLSRPARLRQHLRSSSSSSDANIRPTGNERLHSFLALSDDHVVACLTLDRSPGRARFSARERAVAGALHAEAGFIYRADVMLASTRTHNLTRRQRETLRHLLTGLAEKQIAAAMQLSANTVHHYIKTLHKHFGVSTRSELLALWVGK